MKQKKKKSNQIAMFKKNHATLSFGTKLPLTFLWSSPPSSPAHAFYGPTTFFFLRSPKNLCFGPLFTELFLFRSCCCRPGGELQPILESGDGSWTRETPSVDNNNDNTNENNASSLKLIFSCKTVWFNEQDRSDLSLSMRCVLEI